ncbi:hemin ABC transporter substrate-binding protein [Marinobacter nanhaiticus D15-8W]|uniref:ABC transporter substrate-binding protein n=1 Tax=Marinobacter nanhaiticus D15-8W TaxID=626887 RepID=N6WW09_9GAMM|nr:helical backbone metal receptor [Marinobacter nanhaiticus]ENO15741.1 ABC transporter substrate-binding protein [Marinobacter nanhaiticus D15-8W]BES73401.1 hemin ABC transporter substrate-binding protein [Marinobacter nanhaiticus D15-8W]
MQLRKIIGLAAILILGWAGAKAAAEPRIVSADGAITETIVALHATDLLVGVDTTSQYPPQVIAGLPKIGYLRALPLEGVLSLKPTRLITTEEAGPDVTLDGLGEAGVDVVELPVAWDVDAALERIRRVGDLVDQQDQANELANRMAAAIDKVQTSMANKTDARVLVLLAAGDHGVMLAGKETAADALLETLGLRNALDDVSGYKPASREALLVADPDAIVIAEARPGQFQPADWPALIHLKAWEDGHRVTANAMLLLGFGPRLPEAMQTIAAIVPESTAANDTAHAH